MMLKTVSQENYVIGLDMGVNNVGWSIVNLDEHKIEKCGVRLFNPSDNAQNRRVARSTRRRLRRAKLRVDEALRLFKSIGFSLNPTIDNELLSKRIKALYEKVERQDIINIVKYMMRHRGYIPFDDEEINFVELNGKYPCEYYGELLASHGKIRALNETVKTSELKDELKAILDKQSEYYPELSAIKDKILKIFSRKREFWEGPGSEKSFSPFGRFKEQSDVEEYKRKKEENSAYEKYLFEDLIGRCNIIYLDEPCAPIANFHAQKFNLINDFTNLTFSDIEDTFDSEFFVEVSYGHKLSSKGIEAIINRCITCSKQLKLDTLFKDVLNLKIDNAKGFRIDKSQKTEMSMMDAYRSILRIFKKADMEVPIWISEIELYNKLIYYINVVPSSKSLIEMLKGDKDFKNYIQDNDANILKEIYKCIKSKYSGYHSLSEKALKKANADMLFSNMNFQQVRKKFDYDRAYREKCAHDYSMSNGNLKLSNKFIDELIASPQVKKSLRQAVKIINSIIKEKGTLPYCISIESEKEINGKGRINEINKEQRIQENLRKSAEERIKENGYIPSEKLIMKVMLYEEINGYCPYCNSQKIDLSDVLKNRIQVEHILPLSKSGNNSYNNKTLSCESCNSKKNNRTPFEWLHSGGYDDFKKRIQENPKFSEEKKQNFLFEEDLDKYSTRFINRNLRDNAYATKELVNQIKLFNYFLKDKFNITIKTLATPGQITHKIRQNYDLKKDRDAGKFHHAVDANIVACIADTDIGKTIIETQNNEGYWFTLKQRNLDGKIKDEIAYHLEHVNLNLYKDYIKSIDDDSKVMLSSQVNKTAQGQISDANINKFIKIDGELYKVSQINNIYEEKTSDLAEYFNDESKKVHLMIRDNNVKLYNKLKDIFYKYMDQKGNPFKNYCFDKNRDDVTFSDIKDFNPRIHGIKASENPKSPTVIKLRYYSKVGSPYMLNNQKYHKRDNTLRSKT